VTDTSNNNIYDVELTADELETLMLFNRIIANEGNISLIASAWRDRSPETFECIEYFASSARYLMSLRGIPTADRIPAVVATAIAVHCYAPSLFPKQFIPDRNLCDKLLELYLAHCRKAVNKATEAAFR